MKKCVMMCAHPEGEGRVKRTKSKSSEMKKRRRNEKMKNSEKAERLIDIAVECRRRRVGDDDDDDDIEALDILVVSPG